MHPSRDSAAERARQFKITLDLGDSDEARTICGILGEALEPAADAVSLFEQGTGWRIEAYFTGRPDLGPANEAVASALGRNLVLPPPQSLPDENWVAMSQAALPPVHAGRFTIHGSHDRARVPRGPNALLIDAGEAFGTAHHATTLGCLVALHRIGNRQGSPPRRVLDLGCGSGVLAIAAARSFPHARVLATDIDAVAVDVARANIRINGERARIRAACVDGLAHPAFRGERFDLVMANILAGPLIGLARGLARIIAPEGEIVLSGLLTPQAPAVLAAYRAAGFALRSHLRVVGWSTLMLVRRPS